MHLGEGLIFGHKVPEIGQKGKVGICDDKTKECFERLGFKPLLFFKA